MLNDLNAIPESPTKKTNNHFHIDERTIQNLNCIKELIPANTPLRDVDIIRATIDYMGNEIALDHPESVNVRVVNVKNGAIDGNRVIFKYKSQGATQPAPIINSTPIDSNHPKKQDIDLQNVECAKYNESDLDSEDLYNILLTGHELKNIKEYGKMWGDGRGVVESIRIAINEATRAKKAELAQLQVSQASV